MKDLDFLDECTNDQLAPLVKLILDRSVSEELSKNENYRKYTPNHKMYLNQIKHEILYFGGYSVLTQLMEPPNYREIVQKVCKKLEVPFHEKASTTRMENAILEKLLWDMWSKLDAQGRHELLSILQENFVQLKGKELTGDMLMKIFQAGGAAAGIIAGVMGQGLATALLGRSVMMIGGAAAAGIAGAVGRMVIPIGNVFFAVYLWEKLLGPAYSVIVPAVVHIAILRKIRIYEEVHASSSI